MLSLQHLGHFLSPGCGAREEQGQLKRGQAGASPARVDLHHPMAGFALDRAAPVEFAAAPLHNLHFVRVKAAAAAHQLAAVDGLGGFVALPPTGAQDPVLEVVVTEIGAGVQVDEVLVCVWLELGVFGHQHFGGSNLALFHLRGSVEFLLEDVAHFAEGGHGFPARLELAGARHTVTLALHPHVVQDGLQEHTQGRSAGWTQQGGHNGWAVLGGYGIERSPNGSSRGWDSAEPSQLPGSPPCHYLPPCLVVVEVHQGSVGRGPFAPLPDVDEGLREGHAVGDVIGAARPLEA